MFTGIVQTKAQVIEFKGDDQFRTLTLSVASEYLANLSIGASIAINGVCLTVTDFNQNVGNQLGQVSFDIIDETLSKTNLLALAKGINVNFERSVTFGAELGGHIVSGHIQTTASIKHITHTADNCQMTLSVEPNWMQYILYKGFVAVNGCSLTVGNITESSFDLHLIPETLRLTNLENAEVGTVLNIEVDQQTFTTVQTVQRYLKQHQM